MAAKKANTRERVFKIAVTLKGLDGASQLLVGILLMIIPVRVIGGWADAIVTRDLLGDPNGPIASHVKTAAANFANGPTHWFAIAYLLFHGVVKLALVFVLLRKILWAFPVGCAVLAAFIVYEIIHAIHTHSIALPILAAMDVIIIVLVWREFLGLRRERRQARSTQSATALSS
ncbi:MAG: DUF2127 domain-containing protein [Sciscionella sp.]|nr:DUF2127 domain-containing protein [Sciscionella sp.]